MFGNPLVSGRTNRQPSTRVVPNLEQLDSREVPALFATDDIYNVEVGRVLTVGASTGVLINDYSDTNFGGVLQAAVVNGPNYVGSTQPLPTGALTLNPNGSFTFIAPSVIPTGVSQVTFQYKASNLSSQVPEIGFGNVTITLTGRAQHYIAVGADAGADPTVKVFEAGTGLLKYQLTPFGTGFTGGVRVAVGDLNNDGVDDIAVVPGVGGAPRVVVYNGRDASVMVDTIFIDTNFRGGAYVAIGDFDGNGRKDLIMGAGETGGPRVNVIDLNIGGIGTKVLADFFAYDPSFRNGVRVSAGDLLGKDRDFVVTAPGAGGAPHIRAWDGLNVVGANAATSSLSFYAGDSTNRDGAFVSTGNFRGDGKFDIVTGSGGGSAVARIFDGRTAGLLREQTIPTAETAIGNSVPTGPGGFNQTTPASGTLINPAQTPNSLLPTATGGQALPAGTARGGVRVTAYDWNGDGLDDIVTGAGPGNSARLRVFSTTDGTELTSILAYQADFLGGVNVAAG